MTKKWLSTPPKDCDICVGPIVTKFIDGRTKGGPWGNMCPACHKVHGVGLGIGKGQLYEYNGKDWVLKQGGSK